MIYTCLHQAKTWQLGSMLGLFLWTNVLSAQDELMPVVKDLLSNVVALTVKFEDASEERGFGFIIGEKDGQLYLVTAGHVVHGRLPKKPLQIQVRFNSNLSKFNAQEVSWFEADGLSLLTLPKPPRLQWQRKFTHFFPQVYQRVRVIGKNGDWVSPSAGEISRIIDDRIDFTMLSMEPGTAGAPLIGEKGIVGMVVEDKRTASVALDLNRIRTLIDESSYPYFTAELYKSEVVQVDEMVFVQGGTFTMGCTKDQENDCTAEEKPPHRVTLSDFYIGRYEVTVQAFKEFVEASSYKTDAEREGYSYIQKTEYVKTNGINWRHDAVGKLRPATDYNHPVIHVSWNDAVAYCKWLAAKTGKKYRLPTEAEWEYAARGGNLSRGYQYAGSNNPEEVCWCYSPQNAMGTTHPVGQLRPNELGLYDLNGNVSEYCADFFGIYSNGDAVSPKGPDSGNRRVVRGGSWLNGAPEWRTTGRSHVGPSDRYFHFGFRVVY